MTEQCRETIYRRNGMDFYGHRCTRKAVADGFCKQHHPDSVKAREAKSAAAYQAKRAADPLRLAQQEIDRLKQQRDRFSKEAEGLSREVLELSTELGEVKAKRDELLRLLGRCEIFIRAIDANNGRNILADIAIAKAGG